VVAAGLAALLAFVTPRAGALPPVFDPVSDQTLEATSAAGAVATFTVTATDDNGPSSVSCDHNSGDTFPIGVTTVSCTATNTVSGETTGPITFSITVRDTSPPVVSAPANVTAEATSGSGAVVNYGAATASDVVDGALTPSCSPASGSTFGLGTTGVTCTATDAHGNTGSASFNVLVRDTTPPTLSGVPSDMSVAASSPGGAVVTWPAPTATDAVDSSPQVNCSPASGSTFPLGTTTVSCVATDNSSNSSPAQTFHVTVTDNVNPTLSNVPGNITVPATSGAGATVTYTTPSATDNADPSPSVGCAPPSGSTFPIGTTTVTCTATDASGNQATATFTITVSDSTAPTLNMPGNMTVEATSASGAAVSYSVSATDNVDPNPTVNCNKASGSVFPLGSTTVTCTATDHASPANSSGPQSFTVNVVDTTPPALANVPAPITLEANSPSGSVATFQSPTAVDLVSGPIPAVVCSPKSGTLFPIAVTTVTCQAQDGAGNVGSATFTVRVADRTPPVISAPPSLVVFATGPNGVPSNDPTVIQAASHITAADLIDPHPKITNDMPDFLPVGHTLVHFFASDFSGNGTGVNMDVNVLPRPAGPVPPLPVPDAIPPDNIANLTARPGTGTVTLRWRLPTNADFDHVVVYRSAPDAPNLGTSVYTGRATTFTDRGLTNGTQYRYVVVSYDRLGNRSVGLAILATPQVRALVRPQDGVTVTSPPVLRWLVAQGADYYNVQLFRDASKSLQGSDLSKARKILSAWPKATRFALKKKWKFAGRTYQLTPGVYRWFVWPGFGRPAQANYGQMLGQSTFVVKRKK
jgi:hypothetical protein